MATSRLIVLPYSPRHAFMPFHNRAQRFGVIVAHRRAGKTVACINELVKQAIKSGKQDGRYAYIAPYYAQAKDVAWTYLKRYSEPLWASEPNETELRVDLLGGARIRLYGADNADRLRGLYLDGCVLDEPALMRSGVWGEVIRPALSDRQGWAVFIGTPMGHNHFYDIWRDAQADPAEWFTMMLRASETGLLPPGELASSARQMTPEQYEQEFECSFEAAIRGAYYGHEMADADAKGRIGNVEYDHTLPVHTAWDLGIGDSTAIWFFQIAGNEPRLIDYYENAGFGLDHYARVLGDRGYVYGQDWVPQDAKVRELGTGRTRVETLISLKRKPRVVAAHKIMDGINAARVTIPLCWFDAAKCGPGIEALRQYRAEYDDDARTFKDAPLHDWTSHPADAFRYFAMAWRELKGLKPEPPRGKTMREITLNEMWQLQKRPEGRI